MVFWLSINPYFDTFTKTTKAMKRYFLLILSLILFSCGQPNNSVDTSAEEAKVRETFEQFIDAIEQGDMEAYLSYFTDDFVGYDPGRPPVEMNDTFREETKAFFESTSLKLTNHETQEVIVRDDIAVHRHTGTLLLGNKKDSSKAMSMNINYLDIMKKQPDGSWKFKMHTVNVGQ